MKILINTSNLYVGGGVQVALSFINELKIIDSKNEYHIFLSKTLESQINKNIFNKNIKFYLIENSPSSLKTRTRIVRKLDALENDIRPDVTFTIFGPSYWKPKYSIHLSGFADGWVYNPDSIAYKRLPFFRRLKMKLHCLYKAYYLKKDSDYFLLETEDAKNKLKDIFKQLDNKYFVVGNTFSDVFNDKNNLLDTNSNYIKLPKKEKKEFYLMYIAHNHVNKNLSIISHLAGFFEKNNIKIILTLDDDSFNQLFSDNNGRIINIGPIPQESCPSIYQQCDALFAPTLLETFSAAYPEAMKMNIPILTSNYSFATDICKDAALYFNPLDISDIEMKIKLLVNNEELRLELIEKGKKRILQFETALSRAEKYIKICEQINNQKEEKNV